MVSISVTTHPVALEALGRLRMAETGAEEFRRLLRRFTGLLTVEASGELGQTESTHVAATGHQMRAVTVTDRLTAVPILRAGLGMLDGLLDFLPSASVGFIGLARDHETLQPDHYYTRLPERRGGVAFLLDPMVATGGSLLAALERVEEIVAPERIVVLSLLAAPEGITAIERADHAGRDLRLYTGSIDSHLDERGYIVPGLGDAGERICGGI